MPSNVFQKPSGRWGARRRVDGAVRQLGTHDTEAEAWEAVARDKRGEFSDPNMITGAEIAEKWWQLHVAALAPATQLNYKRARKRFEERFGTARVAAISRAELTAWSMDQTEQNVRSVFSMFEWARDRQVIESARNPLAGIKGRPPAERHTVRVLNAEELYTLAAGAESLPALIASDLQTMVIVAGRSAVRPGELFALRWRDIDFDTDSIHVRASVDVTRTEKAPKNGLVREIALLPEARKALLEHGRREPDDMVFTLMHGGQFRKTSLAFWFEKVRDRSGFTGYRFYDLRHTALTYLYVDLGLPSYVVAAQAGHQDNGALIERRYGHPEHARNLEAIRSAARRVSDQSQEQGGRVPSGSPREVRSA